MQINLKSMYLLCFSLKKVHANQLNFEKETDLNQNAPYFQQITITEKQKIGDRNLNEVKEYRAMETTIETMTKKK